MDTFFAAWQEFLANLKLFHFQTESYAAHKTADATAATVLQLGDQLMESWQGLKKTRVDTPDRTLKLRSEGMDKICDRFLTVLKKTRTEVRHHAALLAIVDELENTISQSLYLLTFE